MTKARAPLTVDAALIRIAGQFPGGWAELSSTLAKKSEKLKFSTHLMRRWADPDARERVAMDVGVQLDLAYREAGGKGFPLFEYYALTLQLECVEHFVNKQALTDHLGMAMLESTEAHTAVLRASLPTAGTKDVQIATREVEEAISTLAELRTILQLMAKAELPATINSPAIPALNSPALNSSAPP
jgi:hypothetical protein